MHIKSSVINIHGAHQVYDRGYLTFGKNVPLDFTALLQA